MKFVALTLLTVVCFHASHARGQTLSVGNGSLGRQTTPGATNDVWADPPGNDAVFDQWVGDVQTLADTHAWHTTVLMPSTPATVMATYKSSPAWSATTYVLNGRAATDPAAIDLVSYFPARPVGVIFFFHGTGGSASGWFTSVENLAFLREAVSAGYAVAALDSKDRVNRQWDGSATSTNADVANVRAAIDYFTSLGLMTTATPKFSVGMSDGGGFAPKPAYYLGFRSCGIWCASGQPPQVFSSSILPTVWSLARNDDLYDHTGFLSAAQTNLASLQHQSPSVAGELRENPPSPVYPRRFLRIPGLSASDSQTIYNSLSGGGFLDGYDYLNADPSTSGWESVVPATYTSYHGGILDQLTCCYSEHKFYSDFGDRVLAFFGAQHPPFFAGEVPLSESVYYLAFPRTGNPFGYYTYLADPGYIYHFDLGFEYVFDGDDGQDGLYLYDFESSDFFYTSPTFPFPYLYDFGLQAFLYYYPDPSNPQRYNTNGVRYFYNFSTSKIITK